jgi:hypothetical protein
MLEVRDPADMHSVVGEVSARCGDLFRARAEEQGAPGLRFHTWVKTAAVRYQW